MNSRAAMTSSKVGVNISLYPHLAARDQSPALRLTTAGLVVLHRELWHASWDDLGNVENGNFRCAARRQRCAGVLNDETKIVNYLHASVLKGEQCRQLFDDALVDIATRHQQLVNAIAVEIRLAFYVLIEIDIEISHELLTGEDHDTLRPEIVGVRCIAFTHRDHIEHLRLSGRGETSCGECRNRRNYLSGFARGRQRIWSIARVELRIAPVGIGQIPAKY